jgi:hypothetical protein
MSTDQTTKTALDLITGALRKIGQYAPGEAVDSQDANDALDCLNGMLDLWSNQKLSVYNQNETVKTLTAGQSTYTVGVGGDFNTERPFRLVTAYSRMTNGSSSIDFPCQVVTLEKYSAVGMKNQPGPWPKFVYYNAGWPSGQLIFWPVPAQAVEFHLWTDAVFTALNLTDVVALPRGYFMGLQYALAEVLCSEYGMGVPPDIRRFAKEFKDILKAQNSTPQSEAAIDGAIRATGGNDAGWYLTGGF